MAKTKSKAPVEDIEDDDTDVAEDDDLEELVEDEVAEAPKANGAQAVTFGVADLCKYLSKKMGKEIKPRELRTQIRRMAREDDPRVDREIVAGNRARYDWPDGLKDPEVKRIIRAVTGGELEEGKKAAFAALKERKAAKDAAAGKGKKGKGKKTKTMVEELEDDDLEVEDDEIE